jgi:hypothetical protein
MDKRQNNRPQKWLETRISIRCVKNCKDGDSAKIVFLSQTTFRNTLLTFAPITSPIIRNLTCNISKTHQKHEAPLELCVHQIVNNFGLEQNLECGILTSLSVNNPIMRSISSQHCFIGVSIVTSRRKEQIAQFWSLTKRAQTRAFTTSVLHKLISSQAEDAYQLHETQAYGAK